jgi:hypothetical protein
MTINIMMDGKGIQHWRQLAIHSAEKPYKVVLPVAWSIMSRFLQSKNSSNLMGPSESSKYLPITAQNVIPADQTKASSGVSFYIQKMDFLIYVVSKISYFPLSSPP